MDVLDLISTFGPLAVVLVATGCVAGVLAGLLGVGGGIVVVPVLYSLLGFLQIDESVRMHVAVGTSLASIVLTSIMSARAHHRRGAVDIGLLKSWGPWIFAGSIAGTVIAGSIGSSALRAVFGVVALLVAAYMALTPPGFRVRDALPRGAAGWGSAFSIAGLSAMMGIGGGTLCVPYFNAFGFPVHRAVGTAAAIGLIVALPAAVGFIITGWGLDALPYASAGHVNLLGLMLIAPFASLTAPFGAKLAHRMPPRMLKLAFAFFLLVTGLRMLL